MKNKIFALIAAVLMVAGLASTAACGSGQPVAYTPGSYTVAYTDPMTGITTQYCPYVYDMHEIDMYGTFPGYNTCTRVAFPSASIIPQPGTLQYALMRQESMYADFYMGDWWYYHYYYPLGARYHITVISYSGYMGSTVSVFRSSHSSQISTFGRQASWQGNNGSKVSGTVKFPTTNSKQVSQITNRSNTGSGTGGGGSISKPGTITNRNAPAAPRVGRR